MGTAVTYVLRLRELLPSRSVYVVQPTDCWDYLSQVQTLALHPKGLACPCVGFVLSSDVMGPPGVWCLP
jgi:hypothetical protein